MRPALRYHGGKWMLAPWIISYFPPHRTYVEPYGGAASVLLRKKRAYAEFLNDINDEVVNVFLVLRDQAQARRLQELLKLTPFARSEMMKAYKGVKDPVERARRAIVRSFFGFGADSFRRPNGFIARRITTDHNPSTQWQNYADALPLFTERLMGVVIENRKALEVIEANDGEETLFYIDPPYVHASRTSSHGYDFEMTDEDHRALHAALAKVKGKVIISGYHSALYDELYAGWHKVERDAITGGVGGKGERTRKEVLWMNFTPHPELFSLSTGLSTHAS